MWRMRTALAVMAWNRVDHLGKILTSIDENNHKHDLWVFIDGPRVGASPQSRQSIKDNIALAKLESTAEVVYSYSNAGPSTSLLSQIDYLFSIGYGRVIQFCDDLDLSSEYIGNVDYMLDQFEKDQRVGAVSAFGSRKDPEHDPYLDCYTSMANMIGMGIWADRWQQCVSEVAQFCKLGHESWTEKRQLFENLYGKGINPELSLSCDGLLYCSMLKRGQMPVSTVANCLRHVGEEGEFTDKKVYEELGWGKMPFHKGKVRNKKPDKSFFEVAIPQLKQQYGIA